MKLWSGKSMDFLFISGLGVVERERADQFNRHFRHCSQIGLQEKYSFFIAVVGAIVRSCLKEVKA
jgi:hypothetical protein